MFLSLLLTKFVLLFLFNLSSAQFSCDSVIYEITNGNAGATPVLGCVGATHTNTAGQTIIFGSSSIITIPTGLTTLLTITAGNSQVVTYTPPNLQTPTEIISTNSAGELIFSDASGIITISEDTTATITAPDGKVITYSPPVSSGLRTKSSEEETTVSGASGVFTIPIGLTVPTVITASKGILTTYTPPLMSATSNDQTILTESNGLITIPTGLTSPTVVTLSDETLTYSLSPSATGEISSTLRQSKTTDATSVSSSTDQTESSSTTSSPSPTIFLYPVTTTVSSITPTKTGANIPCKLWFFSICIHWQDIHIDGWNINFPPGNYPPGPPPPFPKLPGLTISISGNPPRWPRFSVGPDGVPKFPAEPTGGPDDGCKTESAEYCATTTSYGVITSGTLTSTTTSKVESTCGTLFGCDVTDTATTVTTAVTTCASGTAHNGCPSPTTYPYVVYPVDGTNSEQTDAISDLLTSNYVNDPKDIYTSQGKSLGLNYWKLPLNETTAAHLRAVANVATVDQQCDPMCASDTDKCIFCYDPTTTFKYQHPAERQLQFISWPPQWDTQLGEKYYFDDSNGQGVKVYILDTGANLIHPEFQPQNRRAGLVSEDTVEWIWVHPDSDGRKPKDDSFIADDTTKKPTRIAHGTAMLSLVAGNTLGVAKLASPVIVRLPRRNSEFGGGFTPEDFIDGLQAILDHLPEPNPKNPSVAAVVLLAHAFTTEIFYRKGPKGDFVRNKEGRPIIDDNGWRMRCRTLIDRLTVKGALVVNGPGNLAWDHSVQYLPAAFTKANEPDPLTGLLVVGGTDFLGAENFYPDDRDNICPAVFAPSRNIKSAEGQPYYLNIQDDQKQTPYRIGSGTSDAAALAAGLAAYFIGLNRLGRLPALPNGETAGFNTPAELKDYIVKQAVPKSKPLLPIVPAPNPKAGRLPIPGIFNGMNLGDEAGVCQWDPRYPLLRRENSCQAGTISPTRTGAQTATQAATKSTPHSIANTTSSPDPNPTTPLKTQLVACEDPKDYPGHADIRGKQQADFASIFCELAVFKSDKIYPPIHGQTGPTAFKAFKADNHGIYYWYLIQWVADCVTAQNSMSIAQPDPDQSMSCSDILKDDYTRCNNGGVGGTIQVGCAIYQFKGGLGKHNEPACEGCVVVAS